MNKNVLFQQFVSFTTAIHQTTAELTKDVKTEAITPMQYKILEYLMVSQPVTLSEVSDCMNMSMPNTSRELRKLTEKRLCEKIADNEDRRRQSIRLTAEGEAMMQEAFDRIEERFRGRIQGLTSDDLVKISDAIELLQRKILK
ncbi:MarR family transcriptional regulator [Paenibacillus sp. CAA11]|uniref:MarR family winged helix-turn-helix transcriptional regulator n=1 Tax=Paenibacillus sp. CAA11 TaxID=1532905 RepID=UPI000D376423|nr:MarR family transcriptional regulator [Paenibacillus sp. CAA11]AWB46530.1 MarR family transcriptional regulator [Paenibacillus sp. CAA11]